MATNTNKKRVRVGGSGFTAFVWNNKPIGWCEEITVNSPAPVADPVPIQPLDAKYPLTIITPAALGAGTLTANFIELYGKKVWDDIMGLVDNSGRQYNDLVEIFEFLASIKNPVNAIRAITPPQRLGGESLPKYGDIFENCIITDIGDNETINISTMQIVKPITFMYTRRKRLVNNDPNLKDVSRTYTL